MGRVRSREPGPVGQLPVRIELISMPAGSPSLPSVEPRRVCSNLLETATQPWPDLKGYGQLAGGARTGLDYQGEKRRPQRRRCEGGDELVEVVSGEDERVGGVSVQLGTGSKVHLGEEANADAA